MKKTLTAKKGEVEEKKMNTFYEKKNRFFIIVIYIIYSKSWKKTQKIQNNILKIWKRKLETSLV